MNDSIESLSSLQSIPGLQAEQKEAPNELGQDEFLELMLAQLKHQDPFQPLENGEFIAQIAQFSTVTGIKNMENSLDSLGESLTGNQLLQSSSLLGRTALISSDSVMLQDDSPIEAYFELPQSASNVSVDVINAMGELVHRTELSGVSAGMNPFHWDGTDREGNKAANGNYQISVTYPSGETVSDADVYVGAEIKSAGMTAGANTVSFETSNGDRIQLSDIKELR